MAGAASAGPNFRSRALLPVDAVDLLALAQRTPLARDIAETVLNPPADAGTARLARAITSGMLSPRLREAFGLPWDAKRQRRLETMIEQVRGLRSAAVPPERTQSGSRLRPHRRSVTLGARSKPEPGAVSMSNEQGENEENEGGVVDATSILYIVGGIPAMVTFFVVLFLFAQSCNIAA